MIQFVEREMTEAELARENAGFDEHTLEHGNPIQTSERYTVVVLDGPTFIGCASGLAYKNGDDYNGWFYLTDLFVEKAYRRQGLGAALLSKLEARIAARGIRHIWTMTAGYEAPGFYRKQGYEVIFEHENWYATGHSQVGLQKRLEGEPTTRP
jgi:ribosomal protein S18 acetylase RimI-like enzyme